MYKILLHKKANGLNISHGQARKNSEVFLNIKNFTTQERPWLGHYL